MKNSTSRENSDSRAWWILAQVDSKLLKTFSGYQSLLALYLSGTPSHKTGTSPLAAYTSTTVYISVP